MTYEVQTYTLCEGWVNCWTTDGKPTTFETAQEAQAEIDNHIAESTETYIREGILSEGESAYDPADLRIVEIPRFPVPGSTH
jgi:hypothetical protein